MIEEELVYNFRLGREEALCFLFSIYEKKVVPFVIQYENIFRMCGYDNEDIKMFVRDCVLQAVKGYRFGDKSFNTYYSAIAYRKIINMYRKIEGTYNEKYKSFTIDLSDSLVEERFAYNEEMERKVDLLFIMEIVNTMTEYDKNIFNLYLEGVPYTEIAKTLGISQKKVCNHMQKIKTKLKKWVGNENN